MKFTIDENTYKENLLQQGAPDPRGQEEGHMAAKYNYICMDKYRNTNDMSRSMIMTRELYIIIQGGKLPNQNDNMGFPQKYCITHLCHYI